MFRSDLPSAGSADPATFAASVMTVSANSGGVVSAGSAARGSEGVAGAGNARVSGAVASGAGFAGSGDAGTGGGRSGIARAAAPLRHRMAALVLVGVYPIITGILYTIGPLTAGWEVWQRTLVLAPIMALVMVYGLIPFIQQRFRRWLMGA